MVNVATGLATTEPELEDVLRALGASKLDIMRKVGIPRSLPYFFGSLKVAITLAFVGAVVSETVGANKGIGKLMLDAGGVPGADRVRRLAGARGARHPALRRDRGDRTRFTGWAFRGRQTDSKVECGMARVPYEDEIIISWVELHRDARYLSEVLHQKGPWKGIIAVTRGGLVPAALVARELDIRLIDTICVTSYDSGRPARAAQRQGKVQVLKGVSGEGDGYLLIDDLVDTGKTAQVVRQFFPRRISPASTPSRPAGRWWTPSSRSSSRRSGSTFPGTSSTSSPRRSRTAGA